MGKSCPIPGLRPVLPHRWGRVAPSPAFGRYFPIDGEELPHPRLFTPRSLRLRGPEGRYFPIAWEEFLVPSASEQNAGGGRGDDPDRGHGDHKRADGVAVRVGDPVESLE